MKNWMAILLLLGAAAAQAADAFVIAPVRGIRIDAQGNAQRFEALAVDAQGRVRVAGTLRAATHALPHAQRIDGQGRVLLPGLIDAHGHLASLGESRRSLSLRQTANLPDALAAIAAHAKARPDAAWVLGGGWNQANWKLGRFPTAAELDSVTGAKPALLDRIDGHAAWANSAALKLAGITAETPDPPGGHIERDANGQPSGVLVDGAIGLVARLVPDEDASETVANLKVAQDELLSLGITAMHDAGIGPGVDKLLREWEANGTLKLRIHGMARGSDDAFMATLLKAGPHRGPRYSLAAVKLFADGALGSRGAAMLAPYSDDPHTKGLLFYSGEALQQRISAAAARGFQVNVHAIGDAANRQVLEAFEHLPKAQRAPRHRIEHAQIVALGDISRFARAGVIASIQPTHATSDMNMAEDRVGPVRIRGGYAWQRLRAAGVRIACGSDFPIEEPNPWEGLYAAITREDAQGRPPGGWYPVQRLTPAQALSCFTRDAAYASGDETRWGALAPGQQADFVLMDVDPLTAEPAVLRAAKVAETWVAGERVYGSR